MNVWCMVTDDSVLYSLRRSCLVHAADYCENEGRFSCAAALVRWGGKIKYRLIACFLSNISAKNYQNRLMYVEVVTSQSSVVFLRHTVYCSNMKSVATGRRLDCLDACLSWLGRWRWQIGRRQREHVKIRIRSSTVEKRTLIWRTWERNRELFPAARYQVTAP